MLSSRVRQIIPSATMELSTKVEELKRAGVNVIDFSLGEPDFNTPENVIKICKKAMDDGFTKYTAVGGIRKLRETICKKLRQDNNAFYEPDNIVVSTGAKQALYNSIMALVDPGEEVIVLTPCYVSYIEMIKLAGGIPVLVPNYEDEGFQLNIEGIKQSITAMTKAVIINTPNNPTGAVYTEERLKELGKLAVENNFFIISDEVYEKLVYGNTSHICIASLNKEIYNHTILINGLSKSCSMTGWRMGYSAAPLHISKAIGKLQGHMTTNITSFVQIASIEALANCENEIEFMRKEYEKRRNYMLERLRALEGIKCANADGAFYLMPNVSYYYGKKLNGNIINNSNDFCNYILEQANVVLVPGLAYESPDNIRISYANSMANLTEGVNRIEKALKL